MLNRLVSATVGLQSVSKAARWSAGGNAPHPPLRVLTRLFTFSSFILQVANGRIQSLEATVEKLLTSESKLKQATLALELERSALLQTVQELRGQMTAEPRGPEPGLAGPGPTGD